MHNLADLIEQLNDRCLTTFPPGTFLQERADGSLLFRQPAEALFPDLDLRTHAVVHLPERVLAQLQSSDGPMRALYVATLADNLGTQVSARYSAGNAFPSALQVSVDNTFLDNVHELLE